MKKYYIVDNSILPSAVDKVIKARNLLNSGEFSKVSEAVKHVGISRGTYYKYKDLVFASENTMKNRKAVISLMLKNHYGILSNVLYQIAEEHASVLTINQNIPIHDIASVTFSLDLSHVKGTIDELLNKIKQISGTTKVHLVSID